ncbi:MAG: o-succinylbenzoate synthase [Nakamurella sp.]
MRGGGTAEVEDIVRSAVVFAIPMVDRFRGVDVREGILVRGPAGWAEFAPFRDYDDQTATGWLAAALDSALHPWPAAVRDTVAVNTTVPIVEPERAHALVLASGCRTAKVKVGGPGTDPGADRDRLRAVRDALGPAGHIRIDANALWDTATALALIPGHAEAAGGLEYVEQPCRTIQELVTVRAGVDVPIAADESIRLASDPLAVARAGAADVAVLKVAPLGGVYATLRIAAQIRDEAAMDVVISSAVDSAVGLAAGVAAAACLPGTPRACGLGTSSLLVGDVSTERPLPKDGRLPAAPHAPEPDLVDAWPADENTSQYWRARLRRVTDLLAAQQLSPEVQRR